MRNIESESHPATKNLPDEKEKALKEADAIVIRAVALLNEYKGESRELAHAFAALDDAQTKLVEALQEEGVL